MPWTVVAVSLVLITAVVVCLIVRKKRPEWPNYYHKYLQRPFGVKDYEMWAERRLI